MEWKKTMLKPNKNYLNQIVLLQIKIVLKTQRVYWNQIKTMLEPNKVYWNFISIKNYVENTKFYKTDIIFVISPPKTSEQQDSRSMASMKFPGVFFLWDLFVITIIKVIEFLNQKFSV